MAKSKRTVKRKAMTFPEEDETTMRERILKVFQQRAQSPGGAVVVSDSLKESEKTKSTHPATQTLSQSQSKTGENACVQWSPLEPPRKTKGKGRGRRKKSSHVKKTAVSRHVKLAQIHLNMGSRHQSRNNGNEKERYGGHITHDRLTKAVGLFNPGKKSETVYRDGRDPVPVSSSEDVDITEWEKGTVESKHSLTSSSGAHLFTSSPLSNICSPEEPHFSKTPPMESIVERLQMRLSLKNTALSRGKDILKETCQKLCQEMHEDGWKYMFPSETCQNERSHSGENLSSPPRVSDKLPSSTTTRRFPLPCSTASRSPPPPDSSKMKSALQNPGCSVNSGLKSGDLQLMKGCSSDHEHLGNQFEELSAARELPHFDQAFLSVCQGINKRCRVSEEENAPRDINGNFQRENGKSDQQAWSPEVGENFRNCNGSGKKMTFTATFTASEESPSCDNVFRQVCMNINKRRRVMAEEGLTCDVNGGKENCGNDESQACCLSSMYESQDPMFTDSAIEMLSRNSQLSQTSSMNDAFGTSARNTSPGRKQHQSLLMSADLWRSHLRHATHPDHQYEPASDRLASDYSWGQLGSKDAWGFPQPDADRRRLCWYPNPDHQSEFSFSSQIFSCHGVQQLDHERQDSGVERNSSSELDYSPDRFCSGLVSASSAIGHDDYFQASAALPLSSFHHHPPSDVAGNAYQDCACRNHEREQVFRWKYSDAILPLSKPCLDSPSPPKKLSPHKW